MLSVATNTGALMAKAAASSVNGEMETSMQRLSTGKRLNAARDDAAGMAIASRLEANIRGLQQSIKNALDGQALLDTAEGALVETENIMQRIKGLAVQSANDTNSSSDRVAMDTEAQALLSEIDRISNTTTWAGQNILDGTFTNKSFQVGSGTMAVDQLTTSIVGTAAIDLGLISSSTSNPTPLKFDAEYQVNSYTNGDQGTTALSGPGAPDPIVSTAPNGNYLITWSSSGQDGSGDGIFAQLYSIDGVKIGSEIAVNTNTINEQTHPDTAFFSDGSFIIVWQTKTSNDTDIAAQLFSPLGAKIGAEFIVNSTTNKAQRVPSLAMLSDDTALITYSSYEHGGNTAYDIIGQRVTKDGNLDGSEFQVNINSSGNESESDLVQLSNGNVLVAYTDYSGGNTVHAQIIATNGSAIGSEINIDGPNSGLITNGIDVAALKNGGFAATWQTWNSSTNATEVFVQVFDNSGNSVSSKMSLGTSDSITYPSIAADANGGFAVSWTASANDGSEENVYAQTFSSDGSSISSKFLLNSHTAGVQSASNIEFNVDGNLISAWISENQDGDGKGIFAQNFVTKTSLSTRFLSKGAVKQIEAALQTLNSQRSAIGSLSNRLDHVVANNTNIAANTALSKGRIADADFAYETTNLASTQILQQASTAMLAQANASKQNVLSLLQG